MKTGAMPGRFLSASHLESSCVGQNRPRSGMAPGEAVPLSLETDIRPREAE